MKWIQKILPVMLLALLLCGCESGSVNILPTEPPVEQIAMVVTDEDMISFEKNYPALKAADLRGSTCYEAIEQYAASHPEVAVQYTVSLGGMEADPNVTSLTLSDGDFDFAILRTNLRYLHSLRSLSFRDTALMPETIRDLRAAYPGMDVDYSVSFCGNIYEGDTEEMDLSGVEPAVVQEQIQMLTMFPNLTDIYLTDAEGDSLFTLEDAVALQQAVPDMLLHYTFDLFGQKVSTTDEEVTFFAKPIGRKEGAEETLRKALSIMRGCKRMVLDNCQFDNETLAKIRDDFRSTTKIVWRVWFGTEGGCLTDRTIIRHVYGLYDSNCSNLLYCEDAEFIDFGHNEYLKTCDFVSKMTKLKAIILSGSMISDLSPLANCESLEFLEISYCGYVNDISPLAYCSNLKRLNIAYTKVADLSPLDGLDLEVMVDARSNTSPEERNRFDSLHTDCLVQHTGDVKDDQPYGWPWRYDENGDANEYYALLKETFGYPHPTNTYY